MTPRKTAAYNVGIEAVRQMPMISSVTIEARPDAQKLSQQAAAAVLQGRAEGGKALLMSVPVACSPPDIIRDPDADPNLLLPLTVL